MWIMGIVAPNSPTYIRHFDFAYSSILTIANAVRCPKAVQKLDAGAFKSTVQAATADAGTPRQPGDLVEQEMQTHGFSREKAEEEIKAFGR